MKKVFLLTFVFTLLLCSSVLSLSAQIPWSADKPLTWDNFHGTMDAGSEYLANTWYEINYSYKWDGKSNFTFTVECTFDENKSLKKAGVTLTTHLLRHEQLHFDAAEVYARKIRGAFANYLTTHKPNSKTPDELNAIFEKLMDECKQYNSRYDAESDHSKIEAKQEEWDKMITNELNSLTAYEQK